MKILAIRFARFGDIVLLLPALGALKAQFPGSHLTFVTDSRWKPLAEMCPAIDAIIPVDRIAMRDGSGVRAIAGMARLAREVRRQHFDLCVDFHGFRETNLLAWLSGAKQRLGLRRFEQSFLSFCFNLPPELEDKRLHVGDMFLKIARRFGSSPSARPAVVVPDSAMAWVRQSVPWGGASLVVFYIGAPVPERAWPPENFAAVARHAARRYGATVVALAGPEQSWRTERFLEETTGTAEVRVFSDLEIPRLAAIIAAASVFVSNDTGPMHLGPALGVPTLGLFSVGIPEHFRPFGPEDRFLLKEPLDDLETEEVVTVLDQMWTSVRSSPQH